MTAPAMKSLDSFPRQMTRRQVAQLDAQYMYCIQPFIEQKCKLLGFCQMKHIVSADGSLGQLEFIVPDDMQKVLDSLDELIGLARRSVFGDREIVIREEDY